MDVVAFDSQSEFSRMTAAVRYVEKLRGSQSGGSSVAAVNGASPIVIRVTGEPDEYGYRDAVVSHWNHENGTRYDGESCKAVCIDSGDVEDEGYYIGVIGDPRDGFTSVEFVSDSYAASGSLPVMGCVTTAGNSTTAGVAAVQGINSGNAAYAVSPPATIDYAPAAGGDTYNAGQLTITLPVAHSDSRKVALPRQPAKGYGNSTSGWLTGNSTQRQSVGGPKDFDSRVRVSMIETNTAEYQVRGNSTHVDNESHFGGRIKGQHQLKIGNAVEGASSATAYSELTWGEANANGTGYRVPVSLDPYHFGASPYLVFGTCAVGEARATPHSTQTVTATSRHYDDEDATFGDPTGSVSVTVGAGFSLATIDGMAAMVMCPQPGSRALPVIFAGHAASVSPGDESCGIGVDVASTGIVPSPGYGRIRWGYCTSAGMASTDILGNQYWNGLHLGQSPLVPHGPEGDGTGNLIPPKEMAGSTGSGWGLVYRVESENVGTEEEPSYERTPNISWHVNHQFLKHLYHGDDTSQVAGAMLFYTGGSGEWKPTLRELLGEEDLANDGDYWLVSNIKSNNLIGENEWVDASGTRSRMDVYAKSDVYTKGEVDALIEGGEGGGGGGGTVTSVDGASTAPGLTLTGGAITSAGTLTLALSDGPALRSAIGAGTVTSVSGSGGSTGLTLTGGAITGSGTLTIGGTLVVANGGTGATTLPASRLILGNDTGAVTSLAFGALGHVLTSQGNGTPPIWAAVSGTGTVTSVQASGGFTGLAFTGGPITTSGTLTLQGILVTGYGGTGRNNLASNAIMLGNGTGAVKSLGWGTTGQSLVSQGSGNEPVWGNVAAPTGAMMLFAGGTAPGGWLLCDGSTFSSGTYPALATALGGTTLPDMRGRVPVGAGTGSGLTARTLGATGGAETHQLTIAEMPSHTHNGVLRNAAGYMALTSGIGVGDETNARGGDQAHNNMQPFIVVNYIIKT